MTLAWRCLVIAAIATALTAGSAWPSSASNASRGAASADTGPSSSAPAFCAQQTTYSGTTIVWTGRGDHHSWSDAANWRPAVVPDAANKVGTYADDYVCIGLAKSGKAAQVTIAKGEFTHIAGLDLGHGAELSVEQSRLFLGSVPGTPVVPSYVEKGSRLDIVASALGGNSPLRVSGTLALTARRIGAHKRPSTMTSSECVYAPSKACESSTITPGGGRTVVAKHGHLLVDGTGFGGVVVSDQRVVDSSGALTFRNDGYLAMDDGTTIDDAASSSLKLDGLGGIYPGASLRHEGPATVTQAGSISKGSTDTAIVGVPVDIVGRPAITVAAGDLVLNSPSLPTAVVRRGAAYGTGSCDYSAAHAGPCRTLAATSSDPQAAVVQTSSESIAPAHSSIRVRLLKSKKARLHGHRVVGKAIDVEAPTKRTTASTHLMFTFDTSLSGVPSARAHRSIGAST